MNTNTDVNTNTSTNTNTNTKSAIDTRASTTTKFATASYANPYEGLYNEYKDTQNFNDQLWRDAIKLGDQDRFFSLMQENKNTRLSDAFYDPQYYDYETMMLEMYKNIANNTTKETRYHDIFDEKSQKWMQEKLGDMTDREYIDYELNQARTLKGYEIQRALENTQKENMKWWAKFGKGFAALAGNLGEGALRFFTQLGDVLIGLRVANVAAGGGLDMNSADTVKSFVQDPTGYVDKFGDAFTKYFTVGLTAQEQQSVATALADYERRHTFFRDIDGNLTNTGKYLGQTANSIGNMVPSIVLEAVTGGTASGFTATLRYTSQFGGALYANVTDENTKDTPWGVQLSNAALKTATEAVIEYSLDKVVKSIFGTSSIENRLLGVSSTGVKMTPKIGTFTGFNKLVLGSALQEGTEEFLQDFSTNLIDQFYAMQYEGYGNTGVTFRTLVDSFCMGALVSIIFSGFGVIGDIVKTEKGKKVNNDVNYGEIFVEQNGEVKKLNVFNRMYFKTVMKDFYEAIDKLMNEKISSEENLHLAQEVQAALSAFSQYYSSFDQERIANCQKLLSRVMNVDDIRAEYNARLNPKYKDAAEIYIDKDTTAFEAYRRGTIAQFGSIVENTFNEMLHSIDVDKINKTSARAKKVVNDNAEKFADGDVTKLLAVISDDTEHVVKDKKKDTSKSVTNTDIDKPIDLEKSKDITDIEQIITPKAKSALDELLKDYEYVVITDGHVAIEQDNFLFVSQGWLENYTTSDIYKFLNNSGTIDYLVKERDNTFVEMRKSITAFAREFTGKKQMSTTEALMNFMFNKTVFQAFLLSRTDDNIHQFKDVIFSLYNMTREKIIESGYLNWHGKPSKKRDAMFADIMKQMRETMREPMMVAILNWNFDPQAINATEVLTKKDLEVIRAYKVEKNVIKNGIIDGHTSAAYDAKIKDVKSTINLTEEQWALVDKGLEEGASDRDKVISTYLIMDNLRGKGIDVHIKKNINYITETIDAINEWLANPKPDTFDDVLLSTYRDDKRDWFTSDKELATRLYSLRTSSELAMDNRDLLSLIKYANEILSIHNQQREKLRILSEQDLSAFDRTLTITPEALTVGDSIADIQYRQDCMNKFTALYGISPQNLCRTLSIYHVQANDNLKQLAQRYGTPDSMTLTIRALEELLNGADNKDGEYMVFERVRHDEKEEKSFVITKKIIGKDFLVDGLLDDITPADIIGDRESVPCTEFLKKIDNKPILAGLENVRVRYERQGTGGEGYFLPDDDYKGGEIVLYLNTGYTFLHELNHAIDSIFGIPNGSSPKYYQKLIPLLVDIANTFPELVKYEVGKKYDSLANNLPTKYTVDILKNDDRLKTAAAKVPYILTTGEMLAEAIRCLGLTYRERGIGLYHDWYKDYIRDSSSGIQFDKDAKSSYMTSEEGAENALSTAFLRVFGIATKMSAYGQLLSHETRDTFHTAFTRMSVREALSPILNSSLSLIQKSTANIDRVIKDPKTYLSNEMLEKLHGDFSEGNVYYRLKEYFADEGRNISIDRDANMHTYVLVDDTAFDDILNTDIQKHRNDEKTYLSTKYSGKGRIPITEFYSYEKLRDLGINPLCSVVVDKNVKTETRFDKNNAKGTIYIRDDGNLVDYDFVDKLNHEFRHILQNYNNLETGFTMEFKVTDKMVKDIKSHMPEIFKDKTVRRWAAVYGKDDTERGIDTTIAKFFIYRFTGGEMEAFAIAPRNLYIKPIYVTEEFGKPTIFMPWYNAETGEGRYETDYLVMRSDDEKVVLDGKKKRGIPYKDLPKIDKKAKYAEKEIITTPEGMNEILYKYKQNRSFTKAQAQGTNLEYFIKRGQRNQMDPDLQKFVISTTGREKELAPAIVNAIKKGVLTKQALFRWFREADSDEFTQTTFDLINNAFFHNDKIKNIKALDDLLVLNPAYYWGIVRVLHKNGLGMESMIAQNDLDDFLKIFETLDNSKWKTQAMEKALDFYNVPIEQANGTVAYENVADTKKFRNYMRVLAMQWFDGSLTGAFYLAQTYRKVLIAYEKEVRGLYSLDTELGDDGDDKTTTVLDKLSEDDVIKGESKAIGNDIRALYAMNLDVSEDEMITTLTERYYRHLLKKTGKKSQELNEQEKTALLRQSMKYHNHLVELDSDVLQAKYADYINSKITNTPMKVNVLETTADGYRKSRVNIQARIKSNSSRLLSLIRQGRFPFKSLPTQVQDMFTLEEVNVKGKKIKTYVLKPEVYQVGRGRVTLPTSATKGRILYGGKQAIGEGNEAYRHDLTQILENDRLLRNTLTAVRERVRIKEETVKKSVSSLGKLQKKIDNLMAEEIKTKIDPTKTEKVKKTKIEIDRPTTVKSDVPAQFTIVSSIDMPEKLKDIFNTSFLAMADTKVQFASKDINGKLYEKGDKEFESRVNHEVVNRKEFYEANRNILLELTRRDVLDIVEFFQKGVATLDGPAGKLEAFQLFLLGYFVDVARRNAQNWNFSEAEINTLVELYEKKASSMGSGLNAVRQMMEVINPYKIISQRMMDRYNINEEDLAPLYKQVERLQKAENETAKEYAAKDLIDEMKRIESLMYEDKKKWTSSWYRKLKNFRYVAMLSSPISWIRNTISNVSVTGIEKGAEVISTLLFRGTKKQYLRDRTIVVGERKEDRLAQFDLTNTKVSPEVKAFIDEKIMNNELFDVLYTGSGKYAEYSRQGEKTGRNVFIRLIVDTLEKRYAANHKFSSSTMRAVSNFVSHMISDDKFIRYTVRKYFGKALTQEVEMGHVKLGNEFSTPILNLFAECVILAGETYMHKGSVLGDMVSNLRYDHPVAYEVLTLWQPFLNSQFNWAIEQIVRLTPIGLIDSIYRLCNLEYKIGKTEEQRASGIKTHSSRFEEYLARRDIGKGIIGTVSMIFGVILALAGVLALDTDDDKTYMTVGDITVDISNIFGTSSLLVGAAITSGIINSDAKAIDILNAVGDELFSDFVLSDLLDRHKWDQNIFESMLTESETFLKSFVPQIIQLTARATNDKKIAYSSGVKGAVERLLNSFLVTQPLGARRINPYTGEKETKYALPVIGEFLKSGIIGPKIFWSQVSEEERLCREYDVNKEQLSGSLTVGTIKYKLEVGPLNEYYARLNKDDLAKIKSQKELVEMPDGSYKELSWDKMSYEQRKSVLKRLFTKNAKLAKIYVWTQIENKKYYASENLYKTLKKLGIRKNVYLGDKGFVE